MKRFGDKQYLPLKQQQFVSVALAEMLLISTFFSMSDSDSDIDDAGIASAMADLRTKKTTKGRYQTCNNAARLWFAEHHPECLTADGQIDIPIPTTAAIEFLASHCRRGYERNKVKDGEEIPEGQLEPVAYSTLNNFRSSLKDLYKQRNIAPTGDLDSEISKLIMGYQKLLNDLRKRGLFKITEGKQALTSTGYYMLAECLLDFDPRTRKVGAQASTGSFAWAFFTIMWNLMSRTDSVDCICLQHIGWREDSLVIQEQGHKGDQTGSEKYWKHVYANPHDPEVCPVLAMAVLIFAGPPRTTTGRQQLFLGSNSKDRFAKQLNQVIRGLTEAQLQTLAQDRADIGPYSLRKGSASYCLGQTSGSNPMTVQLRMGHSLGKVNDAYFFAGDGQDQLCGRMVCGLPFNDESFAVLPPHFSTAVQAVLDIDMWREVVDGYDNYPDGFKTCFPYLLATLLYHEDYLRAHLYDAHPLWNSRVFANNPHLPLLRAEGAVLTGIGCCPDTNMRATGIPPHLAITEKLKILIHDCAKMFTDTQTMRAEIFDRLPGLVAVAVGDELRTNFQVDGVVPLSLNDMNRRFDQMQGTIMGMLQGMQTAAAALPEGGVRTDNVDRGAAWWGQWDWQDGRMTHFIP
jgi:hypothetical protein